MSLRPRTVTEPLSVARLQRGPDRAEAFFCCLDRFSSMNFAVTTDAGRMTIHLNDNTAQLGDAAASEIAA